jgi:ribonucleotide monophosphatase NagD (HAD superfamily)
LDPEVGAVIQGLDPFINYSKVAITQKYITSCGNWLVTSEDQCGVTENGNHIPGNGMFVAALEYGL